MGRIDTQVKIRGVRIELEGIESTLCQQEGVLDSACIVDKDRDQIIAFVVTSAAVPGTNCLTEELSLILPSQMVPSHIMILDSVPRTISLKIDRKALGEHYKMLKSNEKSEECEINCPPETSIEKLLEKIIAANLKLKQVSCDADFFELGGTSLIAALVISEFRKHRETQTLSVRDIYEKRTVRNLANILEVS